MVRLKLTALAGLAVAALLASVPAVVAGPGPTINQKPQPRWALSWEEAKVEAKERNVPIFISFHQDG
jgi:hypothetical protein